MSKQSKKQVSKLKDHITQEQYIIDVLGHKVWVLYRDKHHGYRWIKTHSKNRIFSYKGDMLKYNPELLGRGTNPTLSGIESKVHVATKGGDTITPQDFNTLIDYAYSILARLDAPRGMFERGMEASFNDVFEIFKKESPFYFSELVLNWTNEVTTQGGGGKIFRADVECGTIILPKWCMLLSENSIMHSYNEYIVLPIKPHDKDNATLMYVGVRGTNNMTDVLCEDTKKWLAFVIGNARSYLIADENFPEHFRDEIKKLYDDGYHTLDLIE